VLVLSKFWRSLILSLFILLVFVVVELTWVVDSLFYHWFTFASAGIVLVAVPLAWWPVLREHTLLLRLVLALVLIATTLAVLWCITSQWPEVLIYEGSGDFDAVPLIGGILFSAPFALLVVLPILAFGETNGRSS